MIEIKNHLVDTWWIIKKNDNSVMHYGLTPVGMVTNSGLDTVETFTDESIWLSKILEYDETITIEKIYEGKTEEEVFNKIDELKITYHYPLNENEILLFSGGTRTIIKKEEDN